MDFDIFTMDGRLRRSHYLAYIFIIGIASYVIQFLASLLAEGPMQIVIMLIGILPLSWTSFCISVQRAHDWGTSAAYVIWMSAAGFAGAIFLIFGSVMLLTASQSAFPAIGLGSLLLFGYVVMSLILLFAPPSDDNEWGSNPR